MFKVVLIYKKKNEMIELTKLDASIFFCTANNKNIKPIT